MVKTIPAEWHLDWEQLTQIYEVEKAQAAILKNAVASKRKALYGPVYEEYFKKLPFHPQFTIKQNDALKASRVQYQLKQILPLLKAKGSFMEIGAGDCSLSIAISPHSEVVYALEVSNEIALNSHLPVNVKLTIFDGFNIPLADNSVDLAYSNQLMEHLHPDDALEQLESIHRVLKPGGAYICITPNRISGPHDISRFFTDKNVGFHLKEYSAYDLKQVFKDAGFSKTIAYAILKGRQVNFPFFIVATIERIAEALPRNIRHIFLNLKPVKIIFTATIAAIK